MLGSVETVLVCRASAETVAPCPTGQSAFPVQALIFDTSAQSLIDASLSPVDFSEAGVYWSLSFSMIVAIWAFAQLFRRAIRAFQ